MNKTIPVSVRMDAGLNERVTAVARTRSPEFLRH